MWLAEQFLSVRPPVVGTQCRQCGVGIGNWRKLCETCKLRPCALCGGMWLDGGNITAEMNHGVYHPSARLKVKRVAPRITFGLIAYTYSTQPGGSNSVDDCHMVVDRVNPN